MRAFLEVPRFAVLGTIQSDGMPHLTVLWYELHDNEVLLNTARQRQKTANLERDPRAALVIEDGDRYIALYGTVTLVNDQEIAHADIRRLAVRYRGEDAGEQLYHDEYSSQERISLRFAIERVDSFGFAE
jgi:PPOX class probable F420-dependent enzyme